MPIDGSGEPLYTSIVFVVNASAKASEVKLRAASAAKANNFKLTDEITPKKSKAKPESGDDTDAGKKDETDNNETGDESDVKASANTSANTSSKKKPVARKQKKDEEENQETGDESDNKKEVKKKSAPRKKQEKDEEETKPKKKAEPKKKGKKDE